MSQETPTEHSDLVGGSSAARVIACPGSVARIRKAPKSKGSAYAREGTALHELIAQVLDHDLNVEALLPFTHKQPPKGVEPAWELTVDHELWAEVGQPALDMFDDFVSWMERDQDGEPFLYMVEERGEFPGIPGAFGTSDIVFRCGNVAGIWDWKFGRSKVSAEENRQLLFYMTAMWAKYPAFFKGTNRVMLCIAQPKADDAEPEVWETEWQAILDFVDELGAAIDEAKKPDAPIAKGPWCQFADCKAVCELHMGAAVKLGEMLAKKEKKPEGMDLGAFLSDAMELAEMAEAWASHIRAIAHERLDEGLPVPGWKTVAKRSSGRIWTKEDDIVTAALIEAGLELDEAAPRKVLSVAQAEKALKNIDSHVKKFDDEWVEMKASSGTTMTREGDPRPEKGAPAARARALGNALAKHVNTQIEKD